MRISYGYHNHRVPVHTHTEWQWPLSGVHSIMMEKLAQAGEGGGGGVHAHPPSLYLPSRTMLWCIGTLQLRGQIGYNPPISTLPLYVLCDHTFRCLKVRYGRYGTFWQSTLAPMPQRNTEMHIKVKVIFYMWRKRKNCRFSDHCVPLNTNRNREMGGQKLR